MIATGRKFSDRKDPHFRDAATRPQSWGTISELQIRRILAPTDFSDRSNRALDYAFALARQCGAAVVLLHVVEPVSAVNGANFTSPAVEESNRILIEQRREGLAAVSRKRLSLGVPIETLVRMGRAYSEIADTAKALACDLIVMGIHGAARETSAMGGTAGWVVHHAPCPVVTMGP